jgi:cytochrome oxidase Cu insertion factor (SCO1/SenC/PrrC family)
MTDMKKYMLISGLLLLMMGTSLAQTSFYDFTVKDISGQEFDLSQLKEKRYWW